MSAACSLQIFLETNCSLSTRYLKETGVRKLSDCDRQFTSHLKSLSLNQLDYSSEGHLIASRCGLFDIDLSQYTVCPYHRDSMGVLWQRKMVCQFPLHEGKAKPYRNVSLAMSRAILFNLGTLLPVGSGICRKCIDQVYKLPKAGPSDTDIQADTDVDHDSGYKLRKRSNVSYKQFIEGSSQDSIETGHSSQISNWSEEENISGNTLEILNEAINSISSGKISPLKYQLRSPLTDITLQNQTYIKRKASQVVHSMLELIAPGQSSEILDLITRKPIPSEKENMLEEMIKLFEMSTNNTVKDQLLSIMAGLTTKENLLRQVPGLTKYYVDKVRAVSLDDILNKQQEPPKKRQRMDEVKLEHCFSFFFNSSFHQLVSYGTRTLDMETGDKIVIPDIVRTVCHTSIINMYEKYCKDTNFEPLSKATLYRILKACAASKKRNLHGLDNITADGLTAFDMLNKILEILEKRGIIDRDNKQRILETLIHCKNYLKCEFKLHAALNASCKSHCITWACSDPKDMNFHSECDHQHTQTCSQCTQTTTVLNEIAAQDLTEDETVDVLEAILNIDAWKAHIIRTINQDRGRTMFLENLKPNQMILIMDWAMKWLPLRHREKQSDWFGQKGMSWHVAVGITKNEDATFKHNTWVHILESGKQDWFAVASLVENILESVKEQFPGVTEVFLRSDNAGCYHNGFLWSSLPGLSARIGIQIKGYNFSEPQAGKSYCDAKIAHLRQKMRMFVADGNDIITPSDMKASIDSGTGVTGCQVAVVEIDYSKQTIHSHKWKEVSLITDLKIDANEFTMFHAFEIGTGKTINLVQTATTQQGPTNLIIIQDFKAAEKPGKISNPKEKVEEPDYFRCTEEGCVRSFYTFEEYDHHMYFEKHTFECLQSLSTYDKIKCRWAEKCNLADDSPGDIVLPTTETLSEQCSFPKGWALKKGRKQVRFKQHVRDFLKETFMRGEVTGKKAKVVEVAAQMRTLTSGDGRRVFSAEECLKPSQILSYFSRLSSSSLSKKNNADALQEEEVIEEDEFLEHVIREIEMQEVKDNLLLDL